MTDNARLNLQRTLFAAASGDQQAWREVVNEYGPRVFAVLRAKCADADLAEEIAQSTFCTIASKLGEYVEAGRFEAWLFRIAVNRLRDEMRRRRRHAVAVEEETLVSMADAHLGRRESDVADPSDLASLREALALLSPADREIIHLRHFGGLSFRQIADLLEEPLGTVLARQHRALAKLAELMGADSTAESKRPSKVEKRTQSSREKRQ